MTICACFPSPLLVVVTRIISDKDRWMNKSTNPLRIFLYPILYLWRKGRLSGCGCVQQPEGLENGPRFIILIDSELLVVFNLQGASFDEIRYTNLHWPKEEQCWKWFRHDHFFEYFPYSTCCPVSRDCSRFLRILSCDNVLNVPGSECFLIVHV